MPRDELIPSCIQRENCRGAMLVLKTKFNFGQWQKPSPMTVAGLSIALLLCHGIILNPTFSLFGIFNEACLLCAENSFWYKSRCSSFGQAFEQAVKLYMEIGPERRGENKLKILGNWPASEDKWREYQSSMIRILLEHRLRMSNSVFPHSVFNLLLLQHTRNKPNFQLPYSAIVLHSRTVADEYNMILVDLIDRISR